MSDQKKKKRSWGDTRYGRRVKDVTGLQVIMANLFPNRTDCEVCLQDELDVTELLKYVEKKNAQHPEYKTTVFHCVVAAVDRMVRERPLMNRYVQGRRFYERDEVSISFVAKRRFADGADEALMVLVPKDTDTIDDISKKIYGDVTRTREHEHAVDGLDKIMDGLAKLPRPLLMLVVKIVRILDFWGHCPAALSDGDPNYTTVLLSNLGSIKCPSVYHHLNNYGTNSIMVTVGTYHKESKVMPDGTTEIRDVLDIAATLDERIADGFYFARSLKLIKHICANPELLDRPLGESSEFDYK